MGWSVRFVPNTCQSISVSINKQFWMTWHASQGEIRVLLPPASAAVSPIKLFAVVYPEGKSGTLVVYWNNLLRKKMDITSDEEHEISNP